MSALKIRVLGNSKRSFFECLCFVFGNPPGLDRRHRDTQKVSVLSLWAGLAMKRVSE